MIVVDHQGLLRLVRLQLIVEYQGSSATLAQPDHHTMAVAAADDVALAWHNPLQQDW